MIPSSFLHLFTPIIVNSSMKSTDIKTDMAKLSLNLTSIKTISRCYIWNDKHSSVITNPNIS